MELLDTLEKGDVLKSNSADQNMIASLKASLNLNSNRLIKNKHETYYSNWFEFKLPEKVYVYTVENLYGLNLENVPYQVKFEHDYIVSFACPKCLKESLKFNQFEDIDAAQFIEENHFQLSKRNSLIKDTKNKVVELLHGCFNDFMLDSLPYI